MTEPTQTAAVASRPCPECFPSDPAARVRYRCVVHEHNPKAKVTSGVERTVTFEPNHQERLQWVVSDPVRDPDHPWVTRRVLARFSFEADALTWAGEQRG